MKYFLLCILSGVTLQGVAQTIEATFITGDKIVKGLIDRHAWRNEKRLDAIDPSLLNLLTIDYAMIEGIRYAPIEPGQIQEFQGATDAEFVLLEVLVFGTISLYQINREELRFFVSKNGSYFELVRARNAHGDLQDVFKHTLYALLEDCQAISSVQIGKLELTETKLKAVVREYNAECGNQTYVQKSLQCSIGPILGYGWSTYDLTDKYRDLNTFFVEFAAADAFNVQHKMVGGTLNIRNPLKRMGVQFNTSLFYQRIDGTNNSTIVPLVILPDAVNVHNDQLSIDMLCIDIGPCLNLNGKTLSYTLGVGLRSSYRMKTDARLLITREAYQVPLYTHEHVLDDSEYSKFSNAFVLDMGIRYKRSFLELSYVSGINEYFNIPLEITKGMAVCVGYYLN